ncbi:MAG: lysophospholipid acyltransferase family protein [Planctomycetota bacterium]|nr:lysophospholipid acyltransferase family protein [Planctomycetota bacterium]
MKIRSRWLNIVLSYLATFCLRLLFLSVRVRHLKVVDDATPYSLPVSQQRFTFSMWHDQILMAVFSRRTWNLAGLISQHRDGDYLADSVLIAGIQPVRGSTSRGGAEAVREILNRPDLHLAMTPDGPRGPRREMKEGIVYISSRSGRPVVPTALTCNRFWAIPGHWSDMAIPKPFSKVILIAGTPIPVPPDLPREEMTAWAEFVSLEMGRLEQIATRIQNGDVAAIDEIDRRADSTYRPQPKSMALTDSIKLQSRAA